MSKNMIPDIVKNLGIEIDEEFNIAGRGKVNYKFTETELQYYDDKIQDDWVKADAAIVESIVYGHATITKYQFEFVEGTHYYRYVYPDFRIMKDIWHDHPFEFALKACGCIFRTKEEAIAARPAKYEELTGKSWEDRE